MSIAWGPALDAEVAYRHQQVRSDFFRPATRSWHRAPARPVSAPQFRLGRSPPVGSSTRPSTPLRPVFRSSRSRPARPDQAPAQARTPTHVA